MSLISAFLTLLAQEDGVLVTVHATEGSVPREVGAWMAVFAGDTVATVGGGRLEWDAMAHARGLLEHADSAAVTIERYALGPSLGQCCGGVVQLRYERVCAAHAATLAARLALPRVPVALFGGGHVGRAIVRLLATLPLQVSWIDSRDEIFPAQLPANVQCEHSEPVQAAVQGLAAGARVVIMSFSHAQDLDIVAACLQRQRAQADLPYVGLIGSKSKWAVFQKRLHMRGFGEAELAHVTCPIGVPGIASKQPEAIAIAVVAQLLLVPDTVA